MKNVLYKIGVGLCAVLCVCLLSTATALAVEDTETPTYCVGALEVGQTAKYICFNKMNSGKYQKIVMEHNVTTDDMYMCFYLADSGTSTSGYSLKPLDTVGAMYYQYDEDMKEISSYGGNNVTNVVPIEYSNSVATVHVVQTIQFETNIPIFPTLAIAKQYNAGDVSVLPQAINYKLSWSNGSWVKPFEDIEINDTEILVPQLANVSHSGFSCSNNNSEKYFVEVYVDSGIQNIDDYLSGSSSIADSFKTNAFGLVSDNSEAQFNGDYISLFDCYGVDNVGALYNNLIELFTTYPTVLSYQNNTDYKYSRDDFTATSPCFFDIWGRHFGKTYMFWRTNHEVNTSDIDANTVEKLPICYTHYRVRYFYYDETSGFHYGPWASVIYFSGGKIQSNAIFQDDNGNIIETTISNGQQDNVTGNITYSDDTNYIDLNNPNSLFGYIRSVANNIDATMGNFSTLFATVFTFIPADIQAMI